MSGTDNRRLPASELPDDRCGYCGGQSPNGVPQIERERLASALESGKPRDAREKGFTQPQKIHEHWHTDIAHVNVSTAPFYT
ncbi:MAG: hypothetical protein U5N56_09890 [Candidatus Marinimicrobia bacterium]|nr:hypothetical protein [Candidatus Neomarinimicrobiota bacterium]